MRDLKFRLISVLGKIVGYEKWYTGSLDSNNFWTAHPCWLYSKDGKYWNPKPIICRYKDQYTLRKDKNDVEIYERDVVFSPYHNCKLKIVYTRSGYFLKKLNSDDICEIDFREHLGNFTNIEVINNIHENVEGIMK